MAIAFLRSLGPDSQGGTQVGTITVDATGVPVGNTIFARICWGQQTGNLGETTISDTHSNPWVSRAFANPSTSGRPAMAIYTCLVTVALVSGDTITITYPGTTGIPGLNTMVDIFSGVDSVLDVANTANGTSVSATMLTQPDAVVAGLCHSSSTDTLTDPGSPWNTLTRGASQDFIGSYQITSTTGSKSYAPTISTARNNACCIVGMKAVASLPSPVIVSQAVNRAASY